MGVFDAGAVLAEALLRLRRPTLDQAAIDALIEG